jgi:hypothetical protein
MKFLNLLALLAFIEYTCSQETIIPEINCGTTYCKEDRGICVGEPKTYCLCREEYDTFPIESKESCTYQRKQQLVAFLLEAFCGFGVGHFYTGNLYLAIPKLIVYLLGFSGILVLRIVNMKTEDNNPTTLMLALTSCVVCCFIIIWHVADAFLYALARYKDGNGVDLLKW